MAHTAILRDQDLVQSPLLWYLVTMRGWLPSHGNEGLCRWHTERSGSLMVYPDHLHCYGCEAHGDLVQTIGVEEFGLSWQAPVSRKVFLREKEVLKAFVERGGQLSHESTRSPLVSTRTQRFLRVPGPLQRAVLDRLTGWWHEQLLAPTSEARRVREYLWERGVFDHVMQRCSVVGYMPEEMEWRAAKTFDALYRVTEEELAQERAWYRARVTWEPLTDDHLAFLRSPRAFAQRLGLVTEKGYYLLSGRLIFSCKNRQGQTRFYQARVLPWSPANRGKFLNPPMKKYPYRVSLAMLTRPGEQVRAHVPGTLFTESPFGPLVACSWDICPVSVATLGEGEPSLDQLVGLPEPIWLAQDNDQAQIQEIRHRQCVRFPGEAQARIYASFFAQQHIQAYRLLPWLQFKGFDEWVKRNGEGASPAVDTMRQILRAA